MHALRSAQRATMSPDGAREARPASAVRCSSSPAPAWKQDARLGAALPRKGVPRRHGGNVVSDIKPPVVLIEGLDGVGKSTLVSNLKRALQATVVRCPVPMKDPVHPDVDLRERMDQAPPGQRREYYRQSNFHASLLIEEARKHGPVVVDRYWPSTAAFAELDACPPKWEALGEWPEGLVIPDIVILLTVDEEHRRLRMKGRNLASTAEEAVLEQEFSARQRVLAALRCFEPIEVDTSMLSPSEVLEEVLHWLSLAELINGRESMGRWMAVLDSEGAGEGQRLHEQA